MLANSVAEALRVSSESANKLDDLVARPCGLAIKTVADWMLASQWVMGMEQMKRQFKGEDLAPNYSEQEIIAVVQMSTVAKFMVTSRVIERFQTDAEQQIVVALLREFTSRQP